MLTWDGYINCQFLTSPIPYGRYPSDKNGCGWIAVFNVLHHLQAHPPAPDDVAKGMSRGVILGGLLGTWPFAITQFLKRCGYQVRWTLRKSAQARLAAQSDAAILLYAGPLRGIFRWDQLTAHYVMLYPAADTRFRILNYGADSCFMSADSLTAEFSRFPLTLMIGITRLAPEG